MSVKLTLKAPVLRDDPECDSFLAVSVYDTNLVHYLMTANAPLEWVEKDSSV